MNPEKLQTRRHDRHAWKVFTRKAGAMRHKNNRRKKCRQRKELEKELAQAL